MTNPKDTVSSAKNRLKRLAPQHVKELIVEKDRLLKSDNASDRKRATEILEVLLAYGIGKPAEHKEVNVRSIERIEVVFEEMGVIKAIDTVEVKELPPINVTGDIGESTDYIVLPHVRQGGVPITEVMANIGQEIHKENIDASNQ